MTRPSLKSEMFEDPRHFGGGKLDAGQPTHLAPGKDDAGLRLRHMAGKHDVGGHAAAYFEDELRRIVEAGQAEGRIDAALESIARIRDDAETPPATGDVFRVP